MLQGFKELSVPHTDEPNLISSLGEPVKIRSWQVGGSSLADLRDKKQIEADYNYFKKKLTVFSFKFC